MKFIFIFNANTSKWNCIKLNYFPFLPLFVVSFTQSKFTITFRLEIATENTNLFHSTYVPISSTHTQNTSSNNNNKNLTKIHMTINVSTRESPCQEHENIWFVYLIFFLSLFVEKILHSMKCDFNTSACTYTRTYIVTYCMYQWINSFWPQADLFDESFSLIFFSRRREKRRKIKNIRKRIVFFFSLACEIVLFNFAIHKFNRT